MKQRTLTSTTLALVLSLTVCGTALAGSSWHQLRGPLASGESPAGAPPTEWSETKNVRWKVAIPGRAHASPIVWEDKVFVLSAVAVDVAPASTPEVEPGERRRGVAPAGPVQMTVVALNRATGEVLWQTVAREETPHEGTHTDATWASPSATTDGKMLYAHFGSRGLYAYTLDGELKWSKDLGDTTTRNGFGEGSSPVLAGGFIVVNWDHEGDSFVVALDKTTGEERWRRDRSEATSWATPIAVEQDGKWQVVISGTERVRGYDLETGASLWEAGGQTMNVVPSPIHRDGVVYATSGFRGAAFKAIRILGASGDLTDSESILWSYDKDTPYVPSPLLYGDQLYFLKVNTGILTSVDASSGEAVFGPERLPGIDGVYSSPVAADGRVYIVGRGGNTVVLKHGTSFEVLAENELEDTFAASPAIVDGELFLRGEENLYCIAEPKAEEPAPSAAQ